MLESKSKNFNHLKVHTQYSICEGAIKIDDLKEFSKDNKIRSLALCDTANLCGALEFAEKISKAGTQPIIGTQINFKTDDTIGLLPLFALNEDGYKRIIELSSLSYLNNDQTSEPHLSIHDLLDKTDVDDKIVDAWNKADESGLLDKINCYIKCYGGYLLAVGAGCLFGVSFWWGLGFLVAAGGWAYWQVCKCKACKANMPGGSCCNG